MRGPRNALYASLVLLVLVIAYAMFDTHGMPANMALAFTLLGGCILCLLLFTLGIGRAERRRHHDH